MPEKDEFDIEVDDDVAQALKDPKGGLLTKVVKYVVARTEAERKKAENDAKPPKKEGVFGNLFE